MLRNGIAMAAGAIALLASAQSQAALTTYSSEALFAAALVSGTLKTESFEVIGAGESSPVALEFGQGSTIATLTGLDSTRSETVPNGGRSAHDGTVYWQGGATPFQIAFTSAFSAFGFWGSDIGDFTIDCPTCAPLPFVLKVEFFTKASDTTAAATENIAGSGMDGSDLFFGFADASGGTYEMVRFTNLTASGDVSRVLDGQGFDYLMVGNATQVPPPNPTPEPAALALVGAGLLALTRRRRR